MAMSQVQEMIGVEDAFMVIEVCKQAYERAGLARHAAVLVGLEVTDIESAHIAIMSIEGLPEHPAKVCALNALRRIIN